MGGIESGYTVISCGANPSATADREGGLRGYGQEGGVRGKLRSDSRCRSVEGLILRVSLSFEAPT